MDDFLNELSDDSGEEQAPSLAQAIEPAPEPATPPAPAPAEEPERTPRPAFSSNVSTPLVRGRNLDEVREAEEAEEPAFTEMVTSSIAQNHIVPSLMRGSRRRELAGVDQEWIDGFDVNRLNAELESRGLQDIPNEWKLELAGAENADQFNFMTSVLSERKANADLLAQAGGGKALLAELASYGTDPVGFLIDAAAGGTSKGRMLWRFLNGGTRSVIAEAAIEAALMSDGEPTNLKDASIGMGAAFVLGGSFGAALGPRLDPDDTIDGATRRLFQDTADGNDIQILDSVGAARVNEAPPPLPGFDRSAIDEVLDVLPEETGDRFLGVLGARLDAGAEAARLKRADARRLAKEMLASTLRKDGNGVARTAWSERANSLMHGIDAERQTIHKRSYIQWFLDNNRGTRMARVKAEFRPEAEAEFNSQVGRYLMRRGEGDWHPAVVEAAQAHQTFFKRWRKQLIDSGVARAEDLPEDSWYMPRLMSNRKYNTALQTIGRATLDDGTVITDSKKALEELINKSLTDYRIKNGLEIDEKVTRAVARAYVRRMDAKGAGGGLRRVDIDGIDLDLDDLDEVEDFLRGADIDGDAELTSQVAEVIERLRKLKADEQGEAARPDRLKKRLGLDFDSTIKIFDNQTGQERQMGLDEIFEDDVGELSFNYGRWAAGESAMSEAGTSSRKVRRAIDTFKREASKTEGTPLAEKSLTNSEIELLEFGYRNVMGLRSMGDGVSEDAIRTTAAFKNIAFATKMGSAWLNAIPEAYTTVAMVGPMRILKNMPAFADIVKSFATGKPSEKAIRQILMLDGGLGSSFQRSIGNMKFDLDMTGRASNRAVQMLETAGEGAKRVASYLNMLSQVTDVTRRFTTVVAMDDLDDFLVRGGKRPKWWKRRGDFALDDARIERLREYLSSSAVKRGPKGEIQDLGELPPDVQRYLEEFNFRFTGLAIQDIDRGNLPRFMQDNPIGPLLLQFRSFTTASWTRHTLNDIAHGDMIGVEKFIGSAAIASLVYMGRSYVFNLGDEEKREEALQMNKVLKNGASYAVNTGLFQMLDQNLGAWANGGQPIIFDQQRTSGLGTNLLSGVPGLAIAEDAAKVANAPVRQLRNVLQGEGLQAPTQQEARALFNITGMSTFWFTRPGTSFLEDQLPKQDEESEAAFTFPWSSEE